jgi:hypothetical protein
MNSVQLSQYAVQRLNYVTMSTGLWGDAVCLWRVWDNHERMLTAERQCHLTTTNLTCTLLASNPGLRVESPASKCRSGMAFLVSCFVSVPNYINSASSGTSTPTTGTLSGTSAPRYPTSICITCYATCPAYRCKKLSHVILCAVLRQNTLRCAACCKTRPARLHGGIMQETAFVRLPTGSNSNTVTSCFFRSRQ